MKRTTSKIRALAFFIAVALLMTSSPAFSQGNPEMQAKLGALKQSIAQNQQSLHHYTWVETQEMFFKGESKSTKQSQCQYGPDGKVQKTEIDATPPPEKKRGLKGRVIEKKTDEITDYMQRVAQLIKRYVPPDGSSMQSSYQSGKTTFQPSPGGMVVLTFGDYAKPGDSVAVTFDSNTKKVRSYDVNTYLDSPADVVTLKVVFDSLPDGTNYSVQTVLDATAKQVQIRTTSSGYTKL
jgi:hypothetical protein